MASFRKFLEGKLTPSSLRKIWEKATTDGINVYRGKTQFRPGLPYGSDPGDFGRGIYYTTAGHRAEVYGKSKDKVSRSLIKFKNPLVLSMNDAYKLAERHGTIRAMRSSGDALSGSERMTKDMIDQGYDGLIAVRRISKVRKDREGYIFRTHQSDYGELEIVDYRPYIK